MTLDEAIKYAEEVAEENQRVVDTGIVFDDVTIDMLYCDDTEVIEEHLVNYRRRAGEHRQLAEWLKDYKRLLKQQPSEDCVSRKAVAEIINKQRFGIHKISMGIIKEKIESLPPVTPTRKVGKWIYNRDIQNWECSECSETPKTLGYVGTSAFMTEHFKFCNHCGAIMRGCENG